VFVTTIEPSHRFAANNGERGPPEHRPTILLGGSAPTVDGGVVVTASRPVNLPRADNGSLLWSERSSPSAAPKPPPACLIRARGRDREARFMQWAVEP
jgi:hypothetical protein